MGTSLPAPLKKGAANLQRGFEAVGGNLTLSPDALRFEPHRFNLQSDSVFVNLQTIAAVQPAWARFLGLLPISNNAFVVTLKDGTTLRFVVRGRDRWMEALRTATEAIA